LTPLLYLVHRIPFPPNKGDKVRSFNILRFLSTRYDVHLGTFVDNAEDVRHVSALTEFCASSNVVRLTAFGSRLRSAAGLWTRGALSVHHYRHPAMSRWVANVIATYGIDTALIFSSAMAQYVLGRPGLRTVVDFVDADSVKWAQYSRVRRWPASALYGREARRLLEFERRVAREAVASVFVSPAEAKVFTDLVPESADSVHTVRNGVDTEYFARDDLRTTPFSEAEEPIVFTGAMDYWPNIDGAIWFAHHVLPSIAKARPNARFYIVGMEPVASVRALAQDRRISVTGRVNDVRPYLQHARVAVVPLRIARGIQNKALEAMSMGCPLVVSEAAARSLPGMPGQHFETALSADAFAAKTIALIEPGRARAMRTAARAAVLAGCNWEGNLAALASLLRLANLSNAGSVMETFTAAGIGKA